MSGAAPRRRLECDGLFSNYTTSSRKEYLLTEFGNVSDRIVGRRSDLRR